MTQVTTVPTEHAHLKSACVCVCFFASRLVEATSAGLSDELDCGGGVEATLQLQRRLSFLLRAALPLVGLVRYLLGGRGAVPALPQPASGCRTRRLSIGFLLFVCGSLHFAFCRKYENLRKQSQRDYPFEV